MPVLQRSVVVVDFPVRLFTVPDNRTEVMSTAWVVVRRKGIERPDSSDQSWYVRQPLDAMGYEGIPAASAELVI